MIRPAPRLALLVLLGACADPTEPPCDTGTASFAVDDSFRVQIGDEAPKTTGTATAAAIVAPLNAPQTLPALTVEGATVDVTVSAAVTGEPATLTGDAANADCESTLSIPVAATVTAEAIGLAVTTEGPLTLELGASGFYWRSVTTTLDADDVVPDGAHGPVTAGTLTVTWAQSALDRVELHATTGEGFDELLIYAHF